MRNTKQIQNSNFQCSKPKSFDVQIYMGEQKAIILGFFVLVIWILRIRVYFGFRISIFGFETRTITNTPFKGVTWGLPLCGGRLTNYPIPLVKNPAHRAGLLLLSYWKRLSAGEPEKALYVWGLTPPDTHWPLIPALPSGAFWLFHTSLAPISKAVSLSFGNTSLRLFAFFTGSKRSETTFE